LGIEICELVWKRKPYLKAHYQKIKGRSLCVVYQSLRCIKSTGQFSVRTKTPATDMASSKGGNTTAHINTLHHRLYHALNLGFRSSFCSLLSISRCLICCFPFLNLFPEKILVVGLLGFVMRKRRSGSVLILRYRDMS